MTKVRTETAGQPKNGKLALNKETVRNLSDKASARWNPTTTATIFKTCNCTTSPI